ncbi:serine threonine-protein phosphatase 4 regulatory subunit 4 [Stylonychia lemnae]|uniref:Serine threonine-protein phosphatase 4 regulatory subunit 4 n=1 Tax=Stylonychia lemnae TaxID=5949 RepID=A0A078AR79_STYLE|nr:serine threonine-protein phosphatase 4 regulatory subunit 4 [Stylonychia lemnae]|eukprot:CDW84724.1 serine threonine-protein phosphatase 4 regulatory subunit 4 [Stylonychia lemnae]
MFMDKFDFMESLIREEFPENQERVITEEEIERLTIKDDMSQSNKGVYILKKGMEVILNLPSYMTEKDGNEQIFPMIINSIDHWDDEFLVETISLVNDKNSNKFLDICVNQLTYDTQTVRYKIHSIICLKAWYKWLDLIVEVIPSCRFPVIDEIFQNYEIGERLSFKKAQKIRIRGTEILLIFVLGMLRLRNRRSNSQLNNLENQVLQKYLNQAITLFQDNQWVLRKICAEKLEDLGLEFNSEELKQIFSKEMKVQCLKYLAKALNQSSKKFKKMMTANLNQLKKLEKSLTLNAAYNLPAMNQVFTDKNILDCSQIILQSSLFFEDMLQQTPPQQSSTADTSPLNTSDISMDKFSFMSVAKKNSQNHENSLQVVLQIAKGLHEQFKMPHIDIQQKDNLFQSYMNFLSNDEVKECMIENLGDAIINLDFKVDDPRSQQLVETIIEIFHKLHKQDIHKKNWRKMAEFLDQVSKAAHLMNCRILCANMFESLINLISDNRVNEGIKPSIAKVLSYLIYHNHRNQERKEMSKQIVVELAFSKSFTQRKAYFTFCEQALNQDYNRMSKSFFFDNFFEPIMMLKDDKQLAIRRRFCIVAEKILLKFLYQCKQIQNDPDKDLRFQLFAAIDGFKNDMDEEVSDIAYDCEQRALKQKDISEEEYYSRLEEENKLLQYEQDQEKRDMKEKVDEEIKRKQEEEHKYELYKMLQDPKYQMQRRKTLRQTSKVNIPSSQSQSQKKLTKRNSANDHMIVGLNSIASGYNSNSGTNENKYGGSQNSIASKKAGGQAVKRYNSTVTSSAIGSIKEEGQSLQQQVAVVLASQTSNISASSTSSGGSSSSKIRGNSQNAIKSSAISRKRS